MQTLAPEPKMYTPKSKKKNFQESVRTWIWNKESDNKEENAKDKS